MSIQKKFRNLIYPDYPIIDDLSSFQKTLKAINEHHSTFQHQTNEQLKKLAQQLKSEAIEKGLDHILVPFYALVKEVCTRTVQMTPYNVQIIGAIALHQGKLVEMQTGEGKTLAAVLPISLNALSGKSVHVMTFNDYLAKRDANWMRPVYEFLGLSVGFIQEGQSITEKKQAYNCDITYATAKSIGFDHLRTFMKYDKTDILMPPFNYVIVDEADAILIDEARHPLVLAGDMLTADLDYYKIADFIGSLKSDFDFKENEHAKSAYLIESGIEKCERFFKITNLMEDEHYDLYAAVNLALHAFLYLKKDIDYIIKDGEIKLVDEFTGRIVEDRKWRSGLQTAVEAKEQLTIQVEGTVLNSTTLQHLLQKYPKISGMTATAQSASEEFLDFYGLKTVVIPTNKPCIRKDHEDRVFTTKKAKYAAIVEEVKRLYDKRQPVLIGTLTVKESEFIAHLIQQEGIPLQVLNAKNDEEEASIITKAGKIGTITISTNMAGRGTDIKLGSDQEDEYQKVLQLGGLYVLGTNRHESLRIDRQLRGRSGRQGDVGESRFFVSFEDDLMVKYQVEEVLPKSHQNRSDDDEIDDKKVRSAMRKTQQSIENCLFDVRKLLCEYSDFAERQRQILQNERQSVLFNDQFVEHFSSRKTSEFSSDFLKKLKTALLFEYDKNLAMHLEELSRIRENIYAVQFGGQHPLRAFREKAHDFFQLRCQDLDQKLIELANLMLNQPHLTLEELNVSPPTSTWTYVSNDNPFDNPLTIMLLSNGNIGFTADPLSASLLFVKALMDRWKRDKK